MQWNPLSSLFSDSDGNHDRGQVGIGTLIVFIAMVLVAAIAAGVLVNTAGMLQQSAEQAGQESSDALTQRLQVSTITGEVGANNQLETITMVVQRSAGADSIDLRDVTVQFISEESNQVLTEDDFEAQKLSGSSIVDSTLFMLTETSDRKRIQINVADDLGDTALEAGDTATLKVTTASGATTHVEITVPDPATEGYHEL